ncbi:MAG: hypothetical protein WDN76_05080 [Alphaproteobacteria bacterium]
MPNAAHIAPDRRVDDDMLTDEVDRCKERKSASGELSGQLDFFGELSAPRAPDEAAAPSARRRRR